MDIKEILIKALEDIKADIETEKFDEQEECGCIVCATYKDVLDVIDSNLAEEYNSDGKGIEAAKLFLSDYKDDSRKLKKIYSKAVDNVDLAEIILHAILKDQLSNCLIIDVLTEWGFGDD